MLKIDNSLLVEIGLGGLPEVEKNSFLKHIYETLEMRVGVRLADQMTNEQLDEFERYFEAKDDAGAFKWLETNFPNYKDIVQQEFDKLKAEVAQSAPQILVTSQAAQSHPQAQVQTPLQPFQPPQPPPSPAGPPFPPTPPAPPAPPDPGLGVPPPPPPPALQPYADPTAAPPPPSVDPGQPPPQPTPFPQQQPPAGPGQPG
jgi:hypothetical protein